MASPSRTSSWRSRAARATGLAALNARFGGATVVVDDAADTSFDATLRRCLEAELEAATAEARDALESDEVRAVNEWAKRSIAAAADAPPPPLASPPSCSRTALEARHAELHARAGGVKVTVDYWVRSHEDAATRLVLLRLSECLQHSLREHARLVSIAAASPAPDARREADTYDAIVVGPIAAQYAEVEARIDADALAPLDDADPALDARLDALAQLREAQAELQRLQGRWAFASPAPRVRFRVQGHSLRGTSSAMGYVSIRKRLGFVVVRISLRKSWP